MPALTISQLLGMLLEDPDDANALAEIADTVRSGDAARLGDDAPRLLRVAREGHARRGEVETAARLIEAELALCADPDAEAELWKELGRLRAEELLDDKGAREAYGRALEKRPGDEVARAALDSLTQRAANWKDIGRRLEEEVEMSTDPTLRASLLTQAANLAWQYAKRGRDTKSEKYFRDAIATDPSNVRTVRLFEQTLRKREKWDDLAQVLEGAAQAAKGKEDKLAFYVRAARVYGRRLGQPDRAADCYRRALDLQPGLAEAMTFLAAYYTERERWDDLVALYEDALRSRQKLESEQGILLQIAMVHWRMRGQPAAAEPYFARLRKIDPAHPAMLGFYREYLTATGDEQRLLTILADAQRTSGDQGSKLKLAVEMARAAQGNPATVERAIDAWKAVQRLDPDNGEAKAALRDLYAQAGKWNALVELLKAELDAIPASDAERRVALLREMVPIYRDHLSLDVMVINTYNAILQYVPDDAEALAALARTYEALGRWNDLIHVLTRQADLEKDRGAKVELYMRVANLWIERFANYNQATRPLEQVFELDPNHREALSKLKDIYTKKRAWKPLFDVLRRETDLASDPGVRHQNLVELAKLATDRLHSNAEAIALWRQVLASDPSTPGALDALEKLAEREKDWSTLAEVLERRVEQTIDPQERIKVLQRLGSMYADHLTDLDKSAGAWRRVLEIDPKNGRALRTLREQYLAAGDIDALEGLYAATADWEGLVEVLGSAADKVQDPATRVRLSLRAAEIYESRIGEPARAFRSYERVLAADPRNERAARALIAIYERDQKWSRLPALLEVVLASLPSGPDAPPEARAERLSVLARLRDLCLNELRDAERGFRWARIAYEEAPTDDAIRAGLEQAAARAGAWEALAEAYDRRIPDAPEQEKVSLLLRVAELAETRLQQPDISVARLRTLLAIAPTHPLALASLERVLRAGQRFEELRALALHQLEHAADDVTRREVLEELARLEEHQIGDAESAAAHYRAILELFPDDADALAALDRLATAAGRHAELADVLRRRREIVREPSQRGELTYRLGQLLVGPLDDVDGAVQAFAEVLQLTPGHGLAMVALEQILEKDLPDERRAEVERLLEAAYEVAGKFDKLARLLEGRLGRTKDEGEKRALRLRVAELSSSKLGDAAGAYGAVEAAFLDNPTDPELWDRLADAADAAKQHESLAAAYTMAIETGSLAPADVAELSRRVARLYGDVLGRPEAAEPFHERVLVHDPLDSRAFESLKELYTNAERWDDLQLLYRNRLAHTVDAAARYELLMQVCFLFEELLDDPAQAIRAYQDVLELEPDDEGARHALEQLYVRTQRWGDLAALLRGEVERSTGDARISRMVQLAEVYEQKLGDPAAAVDQLEAVVHEVPGNDAARSALERLLADAGQRQRVAALLEPLYERRYDWPELVRVLEVQLEACTDSGSRISILARIAEIHEARLSDPARAFDALERALQSDPGDARVRAELARLAVICGKDRERAEALERAVAAADTPGLRVELLGELASLYLDRLGDQDRAEDVYERLASVDPNDADAVLRAARALEEIHRAKGDHARLAEDLRRQVRFESDPDARMRLLMRLAVLLEETLGDVEGAIATHRERLEHDPSDVDAMLALERLYEHTQRWEDLVQTLRAHDAVASGEEERREIARRIARLLEEKLGRRDEATRVYEDLVASFGPDRDAVSALARLHEAAERWEALLEVLAVEQELLGAQGATDERAESRFRAAEVLRTRLGDVERAIEGYAEVLALAPGHGAAALALEGLLEAPELRDRVAAAGVLIPLYEASGAYDKLLRALEVKAQTDDGFERLRALRRAAEVAEHGLQDVSRAFQITGRAVRAALAEDDLPRLLADAERHAAAAERWSDLVALLREVAPEIPDAELQADVHAKIARIARSRLNERDLAREYWCKVLEQRVDDPVALDALEEIDEESGDARGLLDTLRRKAEIASEPARRQALQLRIASLCESRLGDTTAAIEAYEQVLSESDPVEAYDGLARLYAATERWSDLASLHERAIERSVGRRVEQRTALGHVRFQRLGDVEGAIEALAAALEEDQNHQPAIDALVRIMMEPEWAAKAAEVLEPVYLARLDWPNVIAALEARLRGTDDVETRKEILARLGDYHETQLEDLDGALETYARLLREDPTDDGVWETLSRLARALEKYERLAAIFDEVLDDRGVDDPALARLALVAGRLHDERTGNLERAAHDYRLALRFDATDTAAFGALESVLLRQGAHDDLLELWRQQVDVAASDADRVRLLHKIASTLLDAKGDRERAVAVYRELLEVDPSDERATAALDGLLRGLGRWQEVAELLRMRIDSAAGEEAVALRFALGEVLAARLDDAVGAVDVYEEILREHPDHGPSVAALEVLVQREELRLRVIELLEPIYRRFDQWKKLIAIHEAKLSLIQDPLDRVRVLADIGRLHEERGRDPGLAFHAWSRAFVLDPGSDELRSEVDRLAARLGAWDDLVAVYEQALASTMDPAVVARLLATIARVHDEKRGDPRGAIDAYERLATVDESDPTPLDALEALHTMVGDWRGLVDVIRRKVDRSYDPTERGELLRRAGSVLEELLADRAGAIDAYRRALAEDDTDEVALESLDRLYSQSGDAEALADVLGRRVDVCQDPEERARLAARHAQLLDETLRRPDEAIAAWERVLGDRPGDPAAVAALAHLYERQARWSDLLDNLRLQAAMATDAETRARIVYRAGEVLERELDDVAEAVSMYRDAIELAPRFEAPLAALLRIVRLEDYRSQAAAILEPALREQGRWDELAGVLELTAEGASDPLLKRDELRKLAAVHEQGRGDADAAFEALRRALAEDPSDASIADDMERIAAERGAWDRVADAFAARASSVLDPQLARALFLRVATIAEQRLGDDVRAIEAYRRAAEQTGDDEETLSSLDRLYEKTGAWPELADVLERRIQRTDDPVRASDLSIRLAVLREEKFGDAEAAFAAYRDVLERDPTDARAIAALERRLHDDRLAAEAVEALENAYRQTGRTEAVAALYDVKIQMAGSTGEKVRLLQEVARIWEEELGRPDRAIGALAASFEADPQDLAVLDELERLAPVVGSWEAFRGLVERAVQAHGEDLDASTRRDLELRAARWYLDRLGDAVAAEARLRAAIEADPEALEAHELLVARLRVGGREADLVAALRAWAAADTQEQTRKDRLREAAEIAEASLGDVATATACHEAILAIDGADAEALDALIRLHEQAGRHAEVVPLLEKRIDVEAEPAIRVLLRRRLAVILSRLGDEEGAIAAYRGILDEEPANLEAIGALEEIFERGKRWEDLRELAERRLDVAETSEQRIAARVRLARLMESAFGKRADAIAQLEDILGEDPRNAEALDELERLLLLDGRIDDAAALLDRRIGDAAAAGDATSEVALLRRLAALREERQRDAAGAIELLERIVERRPDDVDALGALVRLHDAAGDHERTADALERMLVMQTTGAAPATSDDIVATAQRLATLAETKLGDGARAEEALLRAQHATSSAAVHEALKGLYERQGRYDKLAECLAKEVDRIEAPAERGALLRRIAEIYEKNLGDPATAATYLERAADLRPDDRTILLPLCDLYIAAGRSRDAVPVLEKIIASFGGKRTKEVAQYHHRLGVALQGLGDMAGALHHLDAAFKVDLTNVAILRDLGRVTHAMGDFDRAQKTFRALLLQKLDAQSGISKADVYFYLGDISVKQNDKAKAVAFLERALAEDKQHAAAAALLAQIKG
jgi:tetratricopeptide (TPR) repeat protein